MFDWGAVHERSELLFASSLLSGPIAMAEPTSRNDLDLELSAAEARLARQAALVASLAAQGRDTTLAEALLGVHESELNALLMHRTPKDAVALLS